MTTLLERPERPAPVTAPGDGTDARRAIVRWACRLYRREWRQQLLALLLLVVAVGATVVGLGVVSNIVSTDAAVFGTATTRVDITLGSPSNVASDIAKAQQTFGTVEAITHATVPVPGSVNPLDLRDQSPYGTYGRPMLRLVSGHYPVTPDQVALTRGAASTLGLHVGSAWSVDGRSVQVVGLVENPKNLQDDFVLVAPGTIAHPTALSILTHGSRAQIQSFRPGNNDSVGIDTTGVNGPKERQQQSLAVLLLATIGLVFVGLLSVAGFTVMAQRRMRALGMIRAVGATDRQVRLVMLANGAAVGVAGALVGTAVGLVAWFALVPAFEHVVGHRIDAVALQWWAIIAVDVLAVVTAVLAAWWPARAVARIPIVAALSGRPAPPRPAHRFAALGIVAAVVGFVLLASAHQHNTVMIVIGIVATVVGMLLVAPLSIRALAWLGRRAPIATRLALRDLARYQARSGAALAAASLAVGIAATIAITASAQAANDRSATYGNLPTNQLALWISGPPGPNDAPGAPGQAPVAATPGELASLQASANALASSLHADHVVPLQVPTNPNATRPSGGNGTFDPVLVQPVPHGFMFAGVPFVATPELQQFYRIPSNDLNGTDLLTSNPSPGTIQLMEGFGRTQTATVRVRTSRLLPEYTSDPTTVMSPQFLAAQGLTAKPVGWLIQTPHPLSSAQINAAHHAAAAAGMTVETRSQPDHSLQSLRDWATAAGLLVALGVLAMTVGLIRSETANDLRTLSATGASSRTRRTLTGATAGGLALLGGLIGVMGAYLALIAWHWHHVSYLDHLPYLNLAILVLGLPIAALAGGWLAAWRAPAEIAHRPME